MPETREHIRHKMQQIKNKDSQIEILLRQELWKRGLRYRKQYKKIDGHPDIAFIKAKVAVFCDSEFWHGHNWENRKDFKVNQEFWIKKIEYNIAHDLEINQKLQEKGWTVLRLWGNDIRKHLFECVEYSRCFEC